MKIAQGGGLGGLALGYYRAAPAGVVLVVGGPKQALPFSSLQSTKEGMTLARRLGSTTSFQRWWGLCVLPLVLAGCGREGIRVYRVPKEKPEMARAPVETPARPGVQ